MKLTQHETDVLFCMILDAPDMENITIEIVDDRLYAAMGNDKLSLIAGPPILPDGKV